MNEPDSRFKKQGLPDAVKLGQLNNLLHDALKSTNHVQTCCLIQKSDGSLLATSPGFKIYPEQATIFVNAFKSTSHTRNSGVYFNEIHYHAVRADSNSLYAHAADGDGLILVQTKDLIVMASYTSSMYASVAVEAAENLGEYLRSKGR